MFNRQEKNYKYYMFICACMCVCTYVRTKNIFMGLIEELRFCTIIFVSLDPLFFNLQTDDIFFNEIR